MYMKIFENIMRIGNNNMKTLSIIKPGMKMNIDRVVSVNNIERSFLNLTSVVEYVSNNRTLLIQLPSYQSYNYPLRPNDTIDLRVFTEYKIILISARYIKQVKEGNMMLAKVQLFGNIKTIQRRSHFRLHCATNLFGVRMDDMEEQETGSFSGITIDVSTGGTSFASEQILRPSEVILLEIDFGKIEMVLGEIVRIEKNREGAIANKISVKFKNHANRAQQDRIHRYILNMQLRRI